MNNILFTLSNKLVIDTFYYETFIFYEYKLDFLFILKVESSDYDAYEQ